MEKGKKGNSIRETWQTYPQPGHQGKQQQWCKWYIMFIVYKWYDVMKMAIFYYGPLPPKIYKLNLIIRRTDRSQPRDILQNTDWETVTAKGREPKEI